MTDKVIQIGKAVGLLKNRYKTSSVPSSRELITIHYFSGKSDWVLVEDGEVTHKSPPLDTQFFMMRPHKVVAKARTLPGVAKVTLKEF